jgi:hypothetical protein
MPLLTDEAGVWTTPNCKEEDGRRKEEVKSVFA